jgi:thymidylate kinase
MNHRQAYLRYYFEAIKSQEYALLKFIHGSVAEIPESSDVDMLIGADQRRLFLDIIGKGPDIKRIHLAKKSFATYVSLLFNDGSYLEIDLIFRFDRKGTIYLQANEILDHANESADGLKIASHRHNFEYVLLFYLINGADVPERYRAYFSTFSFEQRAEIFAHITGKYKVNINVLDELYEVNSRFTKKILGYVNGHGSNKAFHYLYNKARYVTDVVNDFMHQRGITVTFSGVDGAGKSTIIEEVRQTLQKKYRQKIVVLRHRPSLLPILSSVVHGKSEAEKRTRENLPRQGKNKSVLSSLIRFTYYYLDYLVGQYYIYFRYTLRGYTVLYDRYYFDFIIDSRRSNIVLPKGFMKWCYHFIFKPQVNVFLFASPEIIRSRKQELSQEDITSLTSEYTQLFNELGKSGSKQQYLVINNINLDDTIRRVMNECVSAAI